MGVLVEGEWKTSSIPLDREGRFVRSTTTFRDRITADASSGYPAVAGRYHLYVSWACPWAHRTAILRKLKGLEGAISLSSAEPFMGVDGWAFSDDAGDFSDPLYGTGFLRDIYTMADPGYTGRVTTPVLWDKEEQTIVNNESREIMKMLDTQFEDLTTTDAGFYPEDLRDEIEDTLDALYEPVNNGVYRSGFARRQSAYEEAVIGLFDALDHFEAVLGQRRYLCDDRVTEADWAFFTTLVRFDPVYFGHFKCNLRRVVDYSNLWGYVRDLYQYPGVAQTMDFDHIKEHYYRSHESINPTRIVPRGPILDFSTPHGRE